MIFETYDCVYFISTISIPVLSIIYSSGALMIGVFECGYVLSIVTNPRMTKVFNIWWAWNGFEKECKIRLHFDLISLFSYLCSYDQVFSCRWNYHFSISKLHLDAGHKCNDPFLTRPSNGWKWCKLPLLPLNSSSMSCMSKFTLV